MKIKTFKEISSEWIELKQLSVKYPTITKYSVIIDNHLLLYLNDYMINDFN